MPDDALIASGAEVFGKLPTHGDFIARGVPQRRRERLDAWLATSLADARTRLGDRFDACYDTALPWRFAVPNGAAWLGGALSPSIDAAGRRFPLLVTRPGATDATAAGAAAQCEDLIYAAYDGGWTVDQLYAALLGLADREAPIRHGWWNEATALAGDAIALPEAVVMRMLTGEKMA